jgi:hypothetical protein
VRKALAALALAGCASCLSLGWERERGFEPPAEGVLARIRPGETDLGQACELLGAPLWVREYEIEGAQLVWGWLDERELTGRVSYPLTEYWSPSFQYGDLARRLHGLLLVFDPGWQVVAVREGRLTDLLAPVIRPSVPE